MTGVCPCAVRAEHLDHLRVGEVERPPEVVVDEVLHGAGVDHEHRASRIGELARVVEDLVAVVAIAIVGRVGAEQGPRAAQVGGCDRGDQRGCALVDIEREQVVQVRGRQGT